MFGSESILGKTTLGTVAVFGFFGISGYLIAGSAAHNNVGRYLWQRFLRIFPAFWICLLVTAFLFGTIAWFHYNPGLSRVCGLHCYLTEPGGPFAYVRNNFWLQVNQDTIAKTLPGGFLGYGWNGSLWTLELEFLCYVLLAAFSVLGLLKRRVLVASIAAGIWIAEVVIISSRTLSVHFTTVFGWDWITFFAFKVEVMKVLLLVPIFLSGSLLYLYRERVPDSGAIALGATMFFLAGMVIPVGQGATDYYQTSLNLTAIFLVYPLIWLGIHLPFARVCAVNDYSYGIYIYAFPIQQLLVLWGVNRWGYWTYTLMTLVAGGSVRGCQLVAHREARSQAEEAEIAKAFPIEVTLGSGAGLHFGCVPAVLVCCGRGVHRGVTLATSGSAASFGLRRTRYPAEGRILARRAP